MYLSDILFILLFLFPQVYSLEMDPCPASMCAATGLSIRFPFGLQSYQPKNCSYPGFDLMTCNTQGTTVINLPNSGAFFVREIDYLTQVIQLYDPSDCLPKRLLTLNLKGSPFVASFYHNFTFLSCPASFTQSKFTTIACLSNSTTSVLATASTSLANSMSATCRTIATIPVPVSEVQTEDGFSVDFDSDLSLKWYEPGCYLCEGDGGTCGFESNTSQVLGCFHNSSGGSSTGFHVFRIICVSIVVPTMTMAVGIACFACLKDRSNDRARTAVAALPEQEPTVVINGLDQTTIESYEKLVLGESRRLPGPNDTTCAICLSEYLTKDAVRCIPECKHCFHAECVDEWLRMNSTCPVCRNNPSPAHVDSNQV